MFCSEVEHRDWLTPLVEAGHREALIFSTMPVPGRGLRPRRSPQPPGRAPRGGGQVWHRSAVASLAAAASGLIGDLPGSA